RLLSRNGSDWTKRYPWIAEAALKNRQKHFVIDGEAVLLGVDGVSDFNALHSRKHDHEVQRRQAAKEMRFSKAAREERCAGESHQLFRHLGPSLRSSRTPRACRTNSSLCNVCSYWGLVLDGLGGLVRQCRRRLVWQQRYRRRRRLGRLLLPEPFFDPRDQCHDPVVDGPGLAVWRVRV
ncbi:hypothetical protein SO180_24330, partial [Bradyrhizobium sp. UFLA05-112]